MKTESPEPILLPAGWHDLQDDPKAMKRCRAMLNSFSNALHDHTRMTTKYLCEFVVLKCAPDLLALNVFPNGKEVTESLAAYHAARNKLKGLFTLNDPSVTVVCVGDGRTPRTGATFAFRSAWNVFSVDPGLKNIHRYTNIKRLTCLPQKIEDVVIAGDRVIVVAVHSHVSLETSLKSITANHLSVIANPCCIPLTLHTPPDFEYDDAGILSPCRRVKVWRDYQHDIPHHS